ncbi:hypothetical protein D3C86_1907100 [compost metagenome]
MHIDDAGNEVCGVGGTGHIDRQAGLAEIVFSLQQRPGFEGQRAGIVDALVAGHFGIRFQGEVLA